MNEDKTNIAQQERQPTDNSQEKKYSPTALKPVKSVGQSPPPADVQGDNSKVKVGQLNQELQELITHGNEQSGPSSYGAKTECPPKDLSTREASSCSQRTWNTLEDASRPEKRRPSSEFSTGTSCRRDTLPMGTSNPSPTTVAPGNLTPIRARKPNFSESVSTSSGAGKSYSSALKRSPSSTAQESSASVSQTTSPPKPPPGFPPLPATDPSKKLEMHMTVLSTKAPTKHVESASSQQAPAADTSKNWRWDRGSSFFPPPPSRPARNYAKGRSSHDSRADKTVKTSGHGRGPGQGAPTGPMRDAQPPPFRPFGPGGLKACVVCGSKDHVRCNDRSKMFFD